MLFCIILPLAYPLVYSWVYNNEVVREVPVAVVDNSRTAMSRKFVQRVDASPDVSVSLYCRDMAEAQRAVGKGEVYGVIYFPDDFARNVGRMEQSHVSVYCDMSYMLTYKAIFQTCTEVSQMNSNTKPLEFEAVPMFNTTGGYGNFILPAVLLLIIQQSMFLVIGMLAGTDRERGYASVHNMVPTLWGKTFAYFAVYIVMMAYVSFVVPHLFGFVSMLHFGDWLMLAVPFLLSCSFLGIALSALVRYRENVILLVVFTSIPMLFLTGISWPQSNLPGFWAGVSSVIPSTYGVRAFVRMSSMGARLNDVSTEIIALWIHTVVYGFLALFVIYRRRILVRK